MENMSGLSQFFLFALLSYGMLAALVDGYYTSLGLRVGLKEGNPVARWGQKKLGMALYMFLSIGGYGISTAVLSVFSPASAFLIGGVVAGLETFNAFRNRKLYKAAKK